MTDTTHILENAPAKFDFQLCFVFENTDLLVTDILSQQPEDIAGQTQIAEGTVKLFRSSLLDSLHSCFKYKNEALYKDVLSINQSHDALSKSGCSVAREWRLISSLDPNFDCYMKGGIPCGYVIEISGESGVGKTQIVLQLSLAVQLPQPYGLNAAALYVSTEARLSTKRLQQILASNTIISGLPQAQRPSLSQIYSISAPDLESFDHILNYQLATAVERYNIRLIIIDSITANYRILHDPENAHRQRAAMANRALHLQGIAARLRHIAQIYKAAILVTNQVSDQVLPERTVALLHRQPYQPVHPKLFYPPMALDQQLRWTAGSAQLFTLLPNPATRRLSKIPALGLVWSNQVDARIILTKLSSLEFKDAFVTSSTSGRLLCVIYAAWIAESISNPPLTLRIGTGGISSRILARVN